MLALDEVELEEETAKLDRLEVLLFDDTAEDTEDKVDEEEPFLFLL